MSTLRALRKLLLGETWALPVGIALAVGVAALVRVAGGPGGAWRHGGGLLLAAGLVVALAASVLGARRWPSPGQLDQGLQRDPDRFRGRPS